jgi:hypothetical protein
MMDAKADALERRILNGIMDHSRALMIAKGGPKSPSKLKKRMSADAGSDDSKLMPPPSTAANGLSFALKPRPAVRRNGPPPNVANRRILSLSQISGNTPTGAQAYPSPGGLTNSVNLKRSHSVKTNYMRKSSWNGRPAGTVENKENEALKEEDETEGTMTLALAPADDDGAITEEEDIHDDHQSETGTERRHSFASGSYAESYAEEETPGYDGRSSYGGTGSEYTYASGSSYMTGSDVDRRTSYGSIAARSALQAGENIIDEASEDDRSTPSASDAEEDQDQDDDSTETIPLATSASEVPPTEVTASEVTASEVSTEFLPTQSEIDAAVVAVKEELKNDIHVYVAPTDSGVGTDLATAQIQMHGGEGIEDADYFRRQAEEESTVG